MGKIKRAYKVRMWEDTGVPGDGLEREETIMARNSTEAEEIASDEYPAYDHYDATLEKTEP